VAAVAAFALAGIGVAGLRAANQGEDWRHLRVDGVPIQVVTPLAIDGPHPGVVVAHGFSGSATLMRGFADTLTRHGYVVALLDFTGHGANARPLPTDDAGRDQALQRDLAAAVGYLRGRPDVDPDRIGLVGHSMGAGAVVAYAASDPRIPATVAISLGSEQGRPANLLIVYGGLEFRIFKDTASAAAASGRARVVEVPGTEHISVLYSDRTHAETANWLDGALRGGPGDVRPRDRVWPGALLLLAFGVGFYPLAVVALRRRAALPKQPFPMVRFVVALVLGVGLALVAGRLFGWLPIAVANYEAGYFLVLGIVLGAAAYRGVTPASAGSWWWLLMLYAISAVVVPVHFGLTHAVPVGARWWLLPVVVLGCGVFLFGAELASRGHAGRHATVLVVAALALLGGAVLGVAPGFVTLVVPLLLVLLLWQAAWAAVLRRLGAPAWLIAAVGAVLLAWPAATALPLTAG